MVTEARATADVGRGPGTSLRQDQSGLTQFEEQREDGIHKLTTVLPDGSISRRIESTPSSTGIKTTIERHADGRLERTEEGPGGEIQSTTTYADGSTVSYRDFTAPDGTHWNHAIGKDGRAQTTHDIVDPDGTLRQHVRTFDGVMETTTTKTTKQEDGSEMTRINSPNGDVIERITRTDGTYELSTVRADGSRELVGVSREADGSLVTRSVTSDGAMTVDTSWTSADGHEHRSIVAPDGSTKTYENWEDRLADGTSVLHNSGPNGTETNTIHPDGSTERIKEHSDGTTSKFTRTKNEDGSIDERWVRADGSTTDSHYERNSDGGYTTRVIGSDGTEKTTLVGRDGRVEVHTVNPDGSRVDASFSSDGSGRTDVLDAQGNIDRSTPTQPDPRPVPEGNFTPETFLAAAQNDLGPEILPGPTPIGQTDPTTGTISDTELADISARGIAPPDVAADLDHATAELNAIDSGVVGVKMFNEQADLVMPAGALGDPVALTAPMHTAEAGPMDFMATNAEAVGLEVETGVGPESVAVDGPQENLIMPNLFPDEQVYPGEEQIEGMEPAADYDPIGPDPDAEPLDATPDPTADY